MTTTTRALTADDIKEQLQKAGPRLADLVELQREYDAVGWQIDSPTWHKLRHMLYHLRDATHDLDRAVEAMEHQEANGETTTDQKASDIVKLNKSAVAGLLFSVLQLAEIGGISLDEALGDLWSKNASTFAPDSPFADL